MLFLNPWLLLGMAGVSIPILIHLIRQQAAKPVEWGAMRFLFDTISIRRRKMEWEDLLLMAARCLFLGLIALALARPFITPDSSMPWLFVLPAALLGIALFGASFVLSARKTCWIVRGIALAILLIAAGLVLFEKYVNLKRFELSGRRDVALVIDASASMQLRRGEKTAFQSAIDEAKQVVSQSPRGTAFTVVLGGPAPQPVTAAPLTHRADVLGVLDGLAPIGGTFRAHEALGMATLALAQGTNASKEIIVFTDSQRTGWRLENPAAWRSLQTTWKSLPNPPKLILRSFGTPVNFRNIALNNISLSRPVIGTDREVVIRADVQNTGDQAITPGPISLEIDGVKIGETPVGLLLTGQSETVEFRHQFTAPGPRLVQLRIDAKDDLAADDSLDQVVSVRSSLPVLLVEGKPSGSFFERAAGYSALALAPSPAVLGGEGAGTSFLMDPRVINATSLTDADLDAARVIILADVPRLPANTARTLARKVAEGAGLIVIAGPRAEAEFYNAWRGLDGPLVPLELGAEQANTPGIQPAPSTFNHESLKIFTKQGDLKDANITRWRKTKPLDARATQAAAFSNGNAFIAAQNYGKGRSLLITTALDASSGGLPAKRSFVPFIHELTLWAAGRGTDLNVAAAWNPAVALTSSSGGLLGEYSSNGQTTRRIDPAIDFDWEEGAPDIKDFGSDNFTIRWSGQLIAPVSGVYEISAYVDDDVSVQIEGFPTMSRKDFGEHVLGQVNLEGGKPVNVCVDFQENNGNSALKLYWTPPGGRKEIIPPSAFIPAQNLQSEPLAVADPRGAERKATLRNGRRGQELIVEGPAIPGIYRVTPNAELNAQFPEISGGRLPLVVTRDAGESGFEAMQASDLALIRSSIDLVLPASVKDILAVMNGKGFGREIWKMLAIAALVLLILESILARWVSRSRRSAEDVRVDFGEETTFGGRR